MIRNAAIDTTQMTELIRMDARIIIFSMKQVQIGPKRILALKTILRVILLLLILLNRHRLIAVLVIRCLSIPQAVSQFLLPAIGIILLILRGLTLQFLL